MSIQAVGPLVTVHDSTFEPRTGIGHHPHQRMERLFSILEGAVDHDAFNGITGHMGTGDLGILTEGRRGMVHSEWSNTDGRTRCYVLVYPTEPLPETAAFDAVRDEEARRVEVAPGVVTRPGNEPASSTPSWARASGCAAAIRSPRSSAPV